MQIHIIKIFRKRGWVSWTLWRRYAVEKKNNEMLHSSHTDVYISTLVRRKRLNR